MKKTLNYFTGNQKKISEENFLLFNCLERIGRNQQFFQRTKKKRDEENFVNKPTVKNF